MSVAPTVEDRNFQTEILAAHNSERRAVGVSDLSWSPSLAREAQAWADQLASLGVMQHASQRTHGENLYMNGVGRRTATQMVGGWLDERANYIPGGAHPNVSRTGKWADVGHYTAMVWSTTTEVGCAIGRGARHDFLVCRYNPPGNMRGYAAYDARTPRREVAVAAATPTPTPTPVAVAAAPVPTPTAAPVAASAPVAAKPTPTPAPAPSPVPVQTARAAEPAAAAVPTAAPAAPPPAAVVPVKVPVVDAANPVPVPSAKPTLVAQQAG